MSQSGLLNVATSSLPPSVPTSFTTDSGVAVPVANNLNVFGGEGIDTSGSGATVTISGEDATAGANAGLANKGIASFDSSMFTVTAGFVQLLGGGEGIDSIAVDASTAPGTNPVPPNVAGIVTITGAQVASGTVGANVIRSNSLAANSITMEIQRSAAVIAPTSADNGVSHFDSSSFSVDPTGFVALSATGAGKTITGDSGGALFPAANNWNILGLSGSKTSGSGSTLTVKSPPFSQVGASATSSLNTGEFVTAAVTRTLPASAGLADGDLFIYVCTTAGALVIQSVTAQKIRIGSAITSAAGTATSTAIGDSLTLRFNATDGFFYAVSVVGTWLLSP